MGFRMSKQSVLVRQLPKVKMDISRWVAPVRVVPVYDLVLNYGGCPVGRWRVKQAKKITAIKLKLHPAWGRQIRICHAPVY